MTPNQQRVFDEKAEIDNRLQKLKDFISSPTYLTMDKEDKVLLLDQEMAMEDYSHILGKRFNRLLS